MVSERSINKWNLCERKTADWNDEKCARKRDLQFRSGKFFYLHLAYWNSGGTRNSNKKADQILWEKCRKISLVKYLNWIKTSVTYCGYIFIIILYTKCSIYFTSYTVLCKSIVCGDVHCASAIYDQLYE